MTYKFLFALQYAKNQLIYANGSLFNLSLACRLLALSIKLGHC